MNGVASGAVGAMVFAAGIALVQAGRQPARPQRNVVPSTIDIPYVDARPLFDPLRPDRLPPQLREAAPDVRESLWPGWVSRHDADTRARLDRGDEDSIINLLLFGVTFTTRPRVTERDLSEKGAGFVET